MKPKFNSRLIRSFSAIALALSAPAAFSATDTFNTAGGFTWVCPTGVTSIQVECWGGGGAGGSAQRVGGNAGGGGGGGGAYAKRLSVPVISGNSYTVTIPAAAVAPSTGFNTTTRVSGANVTFTGEGVTVTANGGQGGACAVDSTGTLGTGGVAGAVGAGLLDAAFAGGNGSTNTSTNAGAGGSGASDLGAGNSGSGSTAGATKAGSDAAHNGGAGGSGKTGAGAGNAGATKPGGAGGGAKSTSGIQIGASGTVGQIILTYTIPSSVKANNAIALNDASSWTAFLPTAQNIAEWNSTVLGANTAPLGGNLSLSGILISNPGGLVTIASGNTLTLGPAAVDIDLSAATQDLTVNCDLALGAANVWNVATARTLTLGGVVSGSSSVTKQGEGAAILSGVNTYTGASTVNAGTLTVASTGSVTTASNIVLTVSGATAVANIEGSFTSTGGGGAAINSGGILNTSGTVAFSGANNQAILMGTAGGSGTWNVTGGSVSVNYTSNGWGIGSGGVGTLNVSAGSVVTAATNVFNVGHAAGGTGVLNISGTGLVTVNAGTGAFRIGANATSTGTVNLNGGTLALGRNVVTTAGSTSTFNFNGGLLRAGLSSATYMTGLTNANVRNDGAKIDTNNFNVTIDQALIHSVIGGDNPTDGGLTKSGTGILSLTGANTYTGPTLVSAGQLTVSGAGTLAGTSGLSVSGGAAFSYQPTTIGTALTLGAGSTLSLADGSTLRLGWGAAAAANNIVALGNATVGSGAGVSLDMGTGFTSGDTYTILTAAGGLDVGNYTFSNQTDYTAVIAKTATSVTVTPTTVAALSAAFWTGGLTGATNVWASSDGSSSNWVTAAGGGATSLVPGAITDVTISATSVTTAPTATVLGASMSIGSLTIADTTNGLGLNADGNTLTITPTLPTAGITMNASVPASTIAAAVAMGANQTWTNASANPLTVSGSVSGAFGLTKEGSGLLTLSGVNTYSGNTTLNDNSGTLEISGTGTLGSGNYAGAIAIGTGSTMKFSSSVPSVTHILSGAITGSGGLTMAPSVANAGLNLTNAGNLYSGLTTISAGRLQATPGTGEISPNTSFVITGNGTSGGQLILDGAGTVANNFSIAGVGYSDAGPVNGGAIRFVSGGTSTLTGPITLTGDARVGFISTTSSTAILSGQITGSAGIEFFSGLNANAVTNTFNLSNIGTANDYTGNTSISVVDFGSARTGGRGNVTLGANEQIPHGAGKGIVVFNGADTNHISILELNGFSETINGVSNVAAAGAIIRNNFAGASVLSIGANDTTSSFSGLISNTTGTLALTKIGAGTLSLSGANTFVGATTISAGTLTLDNSLALQNSPLDTLNSTVGDASNGLKTSFTTLQFGGLNGNKNLADVFTTTLGGYSGVTALTLRPGNGADSHVYSGVISDGAAGMTLTKAGPGAQTLSVSNSYTGATTIAAGGALVVGADGALGTIAAGTTVAINASLGLTGSVNYTTTELVSGAGAGTAAASGPVAVGARGFIQGVTGTSTFAGDIQLTADGLSRIGTQDGASLILTGAITQASGITTANILFRVGSLPGDFVTLSNAGNSFGGDTTVFTGTANTGYAGVRLGINNALPTDRNINHFGGTNTAFTALDLAGFNQSLPGLSTATGAGALQIINTSATTPSTLTLNPAADTATTTHLILGGGALGVVNLVKNGTSTQTLNSDSSFSGDITVNNGKLSAYAGPVANNSISGFGASSNTRTITVESGAVLEFGTGNVFGNHSTLNVPNIIVNGGTITNDELVITDPLLIKVNNALGNVTLNSGTITATEGNQNSNIDTVNRPGEGYGAWGLNGTVTSTGTSSINTGAVPAGKGSRILLSSNTADTVFSVTSGTLTVSAPLQTGESTPNYGLTKNGTGTLLLTAANIYTTNTTVNAGTLELADNAQLKFVTGDTTGANNGVTGAGTCTINGDFIIDTALTDSSLLTAGSWILVDAVNLTETFSSSFTIASPGWTESANVWTKTVGPKVYTFSEATGILSLGSADPYAGWASGKGLTGGAGSSTDPAKSADPDNDGKNNLYEFAFDGNPLSGANDGKVVGKVATLLSLETVMTLTLPVRTGAAFSPNSGDQLSALIDAITYRIEGDVNLSTFADTITEVTGTDATNIQAGLPMPLSTGWTYRTFRASGTVPTVPKAFLRAKISE